jgi:hypothetical protein
MSNPTSLIDQSIEALERLAAYLAGEIPSNSRSIASLPSRVRLSKETLLSISVLLPKLQAVRARESERTTGKVCRACED